MTENTSIIELSFWQILAAYVFIVLLLAIVRWRKIPREKEILISSLRMTFQLLLMGYVLMFLFENPSPWLTSLIVLFMLGFAIWNIFQRVRGPLTREMKRAIAVSMSIGTILSLLYFNFVVIQFAPWFNPRYFIPIAGMIIGNSMTGITLGVQTLTEHLHSQRSRVEAALMLGATPNQATRKLVNQSFDAAILPTINSMVGAGIVFLPGMMTGQIISGVNPVTAIGYQIAILLGITGAVALSVILFTQLGYKTYFNERMQLKE
ncbi:ABC transporter permease [Marinococcus halotolerans]|uniref:ABC transporter permease n=1 Tax=Marinococcus halotolerans TaxID=301092 RepID=UPI0003B771D0|nr:iron export ABC transporter permease subunit FetB [Marinococcus halotolerans]